MVVLFAGGFYVDDFGYVAKSCKKCPNGSFVPFEKTPGTRKQDCKSCPEGNKCLHSPVECNSSLTIYGLLTDFHLSRQFREEGGLKRGGWGIACSFPKQRLIIEPSWVYAKLFFFVRIYMANRTPFSCETQQGMSNG